MERIIAYLRGQDVRMTGGHQEGKLGVREGVMGTACGQHSGSEGPCSLSDPPAGWAVQGYPDGGHDVVV